VLSREKWWFAIGLLFLAAAFVCTAVTLTSPAQKKSVPVNYLRTKE